MKAIYDNSLLTLSAICFGLLFPFLVLIGCYSYLESKQAMTEQIAQLEGFAKHLATKQARNKQVVSLFQDDDKQYLEKYLSRYNFKALDSGIGLSAHNRLSFSESTPSKTDFFQEYLLQQENPIQVNADGLQRILSVVEGIPIGPHQPVSNRPQLIITRLQLEKLGTSGQWFKLNMSLLRREYSP